MIPKLTTCTFCGTGCGIYLETAGNRIVGAYPSMSHPANQGKICLRGWHVHEVASSPDRVTSPLLRKNGHFAKVSWEEALGFVASRLQKIRGQYGPESVAFLDSPRCSNEEAYLTQKLARAIIGTNNVDHGAGVYCNNSINVLLDMIGVPAATNSIGELARSGVIIVDGVDLGRQLPTIGGWVIRAKLNGTPPHRGGFPPPSGGGKRRHLPADQTRHRIAPLRRAGQGHRGPQPDEPAVCQGAVPGVGTFSRARARFRFAPGGRGLRRAGGTDRGRGPGLWPGA